MATAPVDTRLMDVRDAVSEICQACEGTEGKPHLTPFFLIVGAGISAPPVPLARTIIEQCQSIARRYDRVAPPAEGSTLDAYSHWFSRAYPGARQRQKYLRTLIEKKPISLASLRLAHLLSARRLTNLVITTNFDDFIARALRLFGQEPAVCDHPRTVGRIDRELEDIQIVHVHGSYLFYDCANLRAELNGRARVDEETSFTMVGLLDSLLWNRSPLVIGYSGWEGDVVMSALNRRLRGGNPLAQSIYWFCYRRSDRDRLPAWLRDSHDVRFVVPPEPSPSETTDAGGRRATRRNEPPAEPVLRAVEVFDELNRQFDIGPPALFANPIEYFANSLEMSLPDEEGAAGDPYAFKALIERLRRAAQSFERNTASRGVGATVDRLRELMRESSYPEAVDLLATLIPASLPKLDEGSRKEVLAAARLAGSAMLAKLGEAKPSPNLASVLVFDSKLEESLADAPPRASWLVGSRTGQFGMETVVQGRSHGVFTAHLVKTLRDPASDRDGDGRISMLEATIEASRRMASDKTPGRQTPVAGGHAAEIALFSAGRGSRPVREAGTLHALLVGIGKYRLDQVSGLAGPPNDVAALAKLLRQKERRLFTRLNLHELLDREATRAHLERALKDVVARAKPEDLVLFYFSGHGARENLHRKAGGPGRGKKPAGAGAAAEKSEPAPQVTLILHDYSMKDGYITMPELLGALGKAKAGRLAAIVDF